MGSGLILLVIVGAWLAVLVPMALRSHDSATALRSTDRFSEAMRTLSGKGARDVLVPRRRQTLVVSETRSSRPPRVVPVPDRDEAPPVARATAGQRRGRVLTVLVGLAALTLPGYLLGPSWLLGPLVVDVTLVAFVVHLRRQAVRRRQTIRRGARSGGPRRAPRTVRIPGVPDRMPVRPAPLATPLPAPAARYEDPLPATGTGGSWSPVPVPPPVYAGAAVAPPRAPRVLDLTRPGRWSDDALQAGSEELTELLDEADGSELDDILDRRRVPGGW